MATIRVKPSANNWRVTVNGVTKSNHRKKSAAKRKASREASSGDRIVIHRSDGTVQKSRRSR